MSTMVKMLAGTAIGAGLIAGFSYFRNIKRAAVHLEVIPKAYIHKLDWSTLTIRVDAVLKNPTRGSIQVKFPYIRLTHKDVLLGSSQVVNKDISIPAFGQVVIDGMMIQIPVLSFFSVAYIIIKALNAKEPVSLIAKVITTIDLGWSKLPFESASEIVLKK